MKSTEIFTPAEYPQHTYVERPETKLEKHLRDALSTPGEVISLSGPSKSGKTVLAERVVGEDLITVTGAGIESPSDLWNRVMDWMGAPNSISQSKSNSRSTGAAITAEGGGSIGIAKGKVTGSMESEEGSSEGAAEEYARHGLTQIIREIGNSDFVVLIDDYHYMERSAQSAVAREIKEAARQRVKIITASVPHRADDVVRGNPELRGRVRAIDLDYWSKSDLESIAQIGFPLLNIDVDKDSVKKFALEASGSPQLMQAICLQCCFELDARETLEDRQSISLSAEQISNILRQTAARSDYSSLVRSMHSGPKKRGTERKEFHFADGTKGDVYRCVLLSLATDPPSLGFDYNSLYSRIQKMTSGDPPIASSIYQACSQVSSIARAMYPDQRVVEWDDDESRIDIIDPYFLFYLRWSDRLETLANQT